MKLKKLICLPICSILLASLLFGLTVSAAEINYSPYAGYEYDANGNSTSAPVGYELNRRISGADMALTDSLNNPTDIFYDNGDNIYILDAGNSRIIITDTEFRVKRIFDTFCDKNGSEISFTDAMGITVDKKGYMYIADTQNTRVLIMNAEGDVVNILTRPDEVLENTDMPFAVTKVLVDNNDRLMVLAPSINLGAFVYDKDGEFIRFYGSNEVSLSIGESISNFFKAFLSKEGRKSLISKVPASFSNFDIDKTGFIYTVTDTAEDIKGAVRRLNFQSSETISEEMVFGDLEVGTALAESDSNTGAITQFTDVDVDSEGFINLLDKTGGKVFQYTTHGQLVSVFGTYGDQKGSFANPSAIESVGNRVYVVDSIKNCIYEFAPNDYGLLYREAIIGLNNYDVDNALDKWNQILKRNTNSIYAYESLGLVYDAMGDYQKSMQYFRIANDVSDYSNSFGEYRSEVMQKYWPLVVLAILAVAAVVVVSAHYYFKYTELPEGESFSRMESKNLLPFYTAFHPIDGFDQLKFRKLSSMTLSGIFVFLLLAVTTFAYFCTGFIFNRNQAADYNTFMVILQTVGMFALFVIANWAVCTLFDGKGSLKEIISVTAYALLPFILTKFICVILSNILLENEGAFITVVGALGIIWSLIILILGLMTVHQYSFSKTLLFMAVTVFGMAVILFLIVLFFTLMQQTYSFVSSVIQEAMLK